MSGGGGGGADQKEYCTALWGDQINFIVTHVT